MQQILHFTNITELTIIVDATGGGTPAPDPTVVNINPGADIQAAIDGNPTITIFQLQDGLHRITAPLTLRAGLTLRGQSRNAILSGSRELHASTDATLGTAVADGATGRYYFPNQTQQGSVNSSGNCQVGFPECHQPEDLWIDDVLQVPQTNITDVTQAGEWHFDYTNNRIYIWGSPASKQVETSVTQKAVTANVNNVTLYRFTIDKFAAPYQAAAVQADDDGQGWTINDMLFRDCHGQAVRVGQGWKLLNSTITRIGQLGMGARGLLDNGNKPTGILIENCDFSSCGVSGVEPGFAGGAMKLNNTDTAIVRSCNVHDTPGNGIWVDIDNEDTTVEGNTVEDVGNQGIFIEISYGAVIRNNTVRRCGFGRTNTTGFGAGIFIAASSNCEIYGNTVEDCHNGITGTQQDRGSGTKDGVSTLHVIENLNVHNNTVQLLQTNGDAQRVGLYVPFQPPGGDLYTARNNRFTDNTYDLTGAVASPFFWQGASKTLAQWNAAGQS